MDNGLTVGGTLGHWPLTTTAADTHTVDDIALLGLVSKAAGLVGAARARRAVDDVELAVLPAAASRLVSRTPILAIQTTDRTRSRKRRTSDCFFL